MKGQASEPKSLKVSVVITVFNRRTLVQQAVASVLRQTVTPHEIIVIDDGSTDGLCAKEIEGVDPCVRFIRLLENRGQSAATNVGIDAAEGDYIAFLDSDDEWLSEKLAHQLSALKNCEAPLNTIVYSNLILSRGGVPSNWNTRGFTQGESLADYLLVEKQVMQTSTLIVPTTLARMVRFDERLRKHTDEDFILRLAKIGAQFRYVDEPLVVYNETAQSMSRDPNLAPTFEWLEIAKSYVAPTALNTYYMNSVISLDASKRPFRATARLMYSAIRGTVDRRSALATALWVFCPPPLFNFLRFVAPRKKE